MRLPPSSTLFPYTTLFRSGLVQETQQLLAKGYGRHLGSMKGLGYRQMAGYLAGDRSEEHTSELQSLRHLVCRLLLEKKNNTLITYGGTLAAGSRLVKHAPA